MGLSALLSGFLGSFSVVRIERGFLEWEGIGGHRSKHFCGQSLLSRISLPVV